jgi:hypothetical protein
VNLIGEVIYQSSFTTEIDLGHVDSGVYFLMVTKKGQTQFASKFVVE